MQLQLIWSPNCTLYLYLPSFWIHCCVWGVLYNLKEQNDRKNSVKGTASKHSDPGCWFKSTLLESGFLISFGNGGNNFTFADNQNLFNYIVKNMLSEFGHLAKGYVVFYKKPQGRNAAGRGVLVNERLNSIFKDWFPTTTAMQSHLCTFSWFSASPKTAK